MKRLSLLTLAGLVMMQAGAYAATVWGTVDSVSGDTLQVSVVNSEEKGVPASLTVKVTDTESVSGIQTGDQVKLNARDKGDGTYEARSVEKVAAIPQGQATGGDTADTGTEGTDTGGTDTGGTDTGGTDTGGTGAGM